MPLSATLSASLQAVLTSAQDLGTASFPLTDNNSFPLTNGTGANQANQMFSDQRTLGSSGTEDLDMAGTLTNAFGATVTFTKIKAILVVASSANGDAIQVGPASANGLADLMGAAGDYVNVMPGGCFMVVAPDASGYAVTASTGDLLTVTNADGAASATYDIIVIGVE